MHQYWQKCDTVQKQSTDIAESSVEVELSFKKYHVILAVKRILLLLYEYAFGNLTVFDLQRINV